MEMKSRSQSTHADLAVFTVCNIAYLPKALMLADSVYEHNGNRLKVFIFDRKQTLPAISEKVDITWVEDLGLKEWKKLAFIYDIIEFSTSLKPYISLKLLEEYTQVIFLDPDTFVYSTLTPIIRDLETHPVVLTPHYIKPQPNTKEESDLGMMRFGTFNLGFYAVRKGKEATDFLNWWSKRCINFSYMESQFGLSTDQKWVSIAPCFFDFIKISFNPGYNMAPWNTFEREITNKIDDKYYVNSENQLTFFHFSNFDHDDIDYMRKRASIENGKNYILLREIGSDYSSRLKVYESSFIGADYAFDYMSNGWYISPTLRRAYASVGDLLPNHEDPFDSNSMVMSFALKNKLISKSLKKYTVVKNRLGDKAAYGVVIRYASLFFRIILRIIGPNKFHDFQKFLIYMSSSRLNNKMWKL